MRPSLRSRILVVAAACLCGPEHAAADTLTPIADAYTRQDSPSRNYGGGSSLWISHWSSRNAFLRFDLTGLSGSTAAQAELRIVLNRVPNDGDIAIHIIQNDWSEFGVTGNTRPVTEPVAIATASVAPGDDGTELRFDVTDAVQFWQASPNTNFGLAILPIGSNWVGASIYSRESGLPARLVVTTSGEGGNSSPVANDDSYEIERKSTATVLDVLANDTDADFPGDALRIVSVGAASDGATIVNNTSSLGYTPAAGFTGTETFSYTVSDQSGEQASATVEVTVKAPATGGGGTVTAFATRDSYTRLDSASRNYGSSSTLWVSHWSSRQSYFGFAPDALPAGAITSAEFVVRLANVPNDGDVGVHVIQSDWSEFGVTGNSAPITDPVPVDTQSLAPGDGGSEFRFDVSTAVRAWQASPGTNFGLAILPAGSNWVGAEIHSRESDFPAQLLVTTAGDGSNTPPQAVDDEFDVDHSAGSTSLDVLANDTDADLPDDLLQIAAVGVPSNGGSVINNGTNLGYAPAPGFTGTETFTYTVADQAGATSTATVSIRVVGQGGKVWRIMPIGDSITEASGSRNSYRRPLWRLLDEAGYEIDFVGSRSGNRDGEVPNPDFDTDHEGHWGWKADRFLRDGNIEAWAPAYQPDVVLIHLGTNDIFGGQSVSSTISEIGQIIDIVRSANPDVIVLLAQIIPTSDPGRPSLVPFNDAIPDLAAAKNTARSPVRVVNQYDGFDAQVDTYDGIHPDLSGENKMAQKWYDTLRLMISP